MVTTTNKGLFEPAANTNSWDIPLNANFSVIDTAFGSLLEIDVTGITTTQTLLIIDYQNFAILFTGTLSANLIYQIPSGVGGQWLIGNITSGAFNITIKNATSGSAAVNVPSQYAVSVCSTGSNVYKFGTTQGSTPLSSSLGVFGGGYSGTYSTLIQYIIISTTVLYAFTFGNLTVARGYAAGVSSSTRGVFGGGTTGSVSAVMDYITFTTTGNATTFGNLTVARKELGGVSSSTRGVFGGGYTTARSSVMDYITIATTGNAASFGSLTTTRDGPAGVSSSTRGVFGGGNLSTRMDYITIATTGNATTFGNLTVGRSSVGGVSNGTRGVFGGGSSSGLVMDYITIATTGNATTFGNLITSGSKAGASSSTRGVFGGLNGFEYITIESIGDATDFGNQAGGVFLQYIAGVSSFSPS